MIDAFRRSSASRITAVMPYYGYARQDRKDKPRVPISAKLVANLLSAAGANRVLTMDLHKAQIQGFFDIPVDHLFAAPVIIDYLARLDAPNLTIVSPDAGGAERARAYAKRLDAELAIIDKRRSDDGTAEVMNVIGDVEGRTCILQDDIIDTAGTITKAATRSRPTAPTRVFACAVHGVLSGPAIERHREVADRQADRDQHDSAVDRPGAALQQDRRAVGGAAARAGDQEHSRGDLGLVVVRVASSRTARSQATTRSGVRQWKQHCKQTSGTRRQERGAADARGGPRAGRALRRRRRAQATAIAVEPQGAAEDSALGVGRQHADLARSSTGAGGTGARQGVPARSDRPQAAARRLLPRRDGQAAARHGAGHRQGRAEGRQAAGRHRSSSSAARSRSSVCRRDIPEHIDIDVSELMLHQGVRVRDIADRREVEAGQRRRHDARPRRSCRRPKRSRRRRTPLRRGAGDAGRARSHQEGQEGRGRREERADWRDGEWRSTDGIGDRRSTDRRIGDWNEADRRPRQSGAEVRRHAAQVGFAVVDELARRHGAVWRGGAARHRRRSIAQLARSAGRGAGQAADVHEPQRRGGRRAAAVLQDRAAPTCW